MLDSRFPFLRSLDSSGLSQRLRRAGSDIARRTGTKCVYNSLRKELFFYYATPDAGVHAVKAFRQSGTECDVNVDDSVRYIQLGRVPQSVKQSIAERRERDEKYDKQQAFDHSFEESKSDASDYADFLHRERCGVAKVISA